MLCHIYLLSYISLLRAEGDSLKPDAPRLDINDPDLAEKLVNELKEGGKIVILIDARDFD